jgi:hypothetical protein
VRQVRQQCCATYKESQVALRTNSKCGCSSSATMRTSLFTFPIFLSAPFRSLHKQSPHTPISSIGWICLVEYTYLQINSCYTGSFDHSSHSLAWKVFGKPLTRTNPIHPRHMAITLAGFKGCWERVPFYDSKLANSASSSRTSFSASMNTSPSGIFKGSNGRLGAAPYPCTLFKTYSMTVSLMKISSPLSSERTHSCHVFQPELPPHLPWIKLLGVSQPPSGHLLRGSDCSEVSITSLSLEARSLVCHLPSHGPRTKPTESDQLSGRQEVEMDMAGNCSSSDHH